MFGRSCDNCLSNPVSASHDAIADHYGEAWTVWPISAGGSQASGYATGCAVRMGEYWYEARQNVHYRVMKQDRLDYPSSSRKNWSASSS